MKHYLFDFDGTLVDSMPTYVSCMLRILDENDIPYGEDIVKIITPLGLLGTAKYFVGMGMDKPIEDIVRLMGEYMLEEYLHRIPAKNHVEKVLLALKEQGAKLHVLTASPHLTLDPCLKRVGIYDLFENVWSCDDSVEEVLFLDDNLNADKTAKRAGMKVCGVYDDSSKDYVEEMKAATDCYIYDFEELLSLQI